MAAQSDSTDRLMFVPLGEQQEDAEAEESQPTQQKVNCISTAVYYLAAIALIRAHQHHLYTSYMYRFRYQHEVHKTTTRGIVTLYPHSM